MKKVILIILTIIMLVFCACSIGRRGDGGDSQNTPLSQVSTETSYNEQENSSSSKLNWETPKIPFLGMVGNFNLLL